MNPERDYVGERVNIKGIKGAIMRFGGSDTVVVFDGKKNHFVKFDDLNKKRCPQCGTDKRLQEFKLFLNGKYSKACLDCLEADKKQREQRKSDQVKAGKKDKEVEAVAKETRLDTNKERFDAIAKEMSGLYARKNADYGNAFEKGLERRGLSSAVVRFDDKVERFYTLASKEQRQVSDETMRDTLIDLANYAIMTVIWLEKGDKNV